jgi:Flp pilus assembly protein TadG
MTSQPRAARRATATVELAVLLPFLVGLLLFAADFARIFSVSITIENASQIGALFTSGRVSPASRLAAFA